MIVPLALFLLTQTNKAPDLPAGINNFVVGSMYRVELKLQANDFAGAAKEAELLPKRDIIVKWDSAPVPQAKREELKAAFDKAEKAWSDQAKVHFEDTGAPDITVSFVSALPKEGNELFPAGAKLFWPEVGRERLSLTIALHRLDTQEEITPEDVYNETAFAIGQYLGLSRVPRFGSFSSRTDQNTSATVSLSGYESGLAQTTLDASDQLRQLISSKTAITVKQPEMALATGEITGVTGTQYGPLGISFTVENRGDADLKLFVLPDCGCLRPESPPVIKPHSSGTIEASVDTGDFPGIQNHSLMIYTNDPKFPIAEIPVHMNIEPLYRFVHAGPDGLQIGATGLDLDVFLIFSSKAQIEPLTASVTGPQATVQFHKWSGTLPFDEATKGATESGYKYHIHVAPSHLDGRISATLIVGTDSEAFRELTYTFNMQKGIVAMPSEVFFGRVIHSGVRASFLVSRPGKPFHIVKVEAQDSFIQATVQMISDSEYRVNVTYAGHADPGDFASKVKVVTDDPSSPTILVPVSGSVR